MVPVRDRPEWLDRCLASLGPGTPVVVVDDGSSDPASVAEVCDRHDARLLVRPDNGGPAVARNDGLGRVDTELVAFLRQRLRGRLPAGWARWWPCSTTPSSGRWPPGPTPRRPPGRSAARFAGPARRSTWDRSRAGWDRTDGSATSPPRRWWRGAGPSPAGSTPASGSVRTSTWSGPWSTPDGSVRYLPSVDVWHHAPSSWGGLLGRRFRYGTSAGPLARRHPGRLAPVGAPAAGRGGGTGPAGRAAPGYPPWSPPSMASTLARRVGALGIPPGLALGWSAAGDGVDRVRAGPGRHRAVRPGAGHRRLPGRGKRRRRIRGGDAWPWCPRWSNGGNVDRRSTRSGGRLASIADDCAYGLGVWAGCPASPDPGSAGSLAEVEPESDPDRSQGRP